MEVNGQWVGYGLGDVSPVVQGLKAYLFENFSYAGSLRASIEAGGTAAQTYDQTMVDVVTQMQQNYLAEKSTIQNSALKANGIMNWSWQVRSSFVAPPTITILTWQGTGVDLFNASSPQPYGASQYVAKACRNVFVQPIGNYPASITNPPMGTSAQMGVDEAVHQVNNVHTVGPLILFGYSQGAICASHFWRDEILNPGGRSHARLKDVKAAVTFGNPCRSPGIANGNANTNWGMPAKQFGAVTGGISGPDCLKPEEVPSWWYDYVWLGTDGGSTELYTNAPVGDSPWANEAPAGHVGTLIYNAVQKQDFLNVVEVAEALMMPVGMVEEIWNGITFLVAGPMADHYDYNWLPAIQYLTGVCQKWTNDFVNSGGTVT